MKGEPETREQELERQLRELENIAAALKSAVNFYQFEAGEALSCPAVVRLNEYDREYYPYPKK